MEHVKQSNKIEHNEVKCCRQAQVNTWAHGDLWRAATPLPSVCGRVKETRLLLAASLRARPVLGPRQEALTSTVYTRVLRWGLGLLQPPCSLFGLSDPVSEVGLFAPIGTRNFITSRKKDPCEQFMVSLPLCAYTAWMSNTDEPWWEENEKSEVLSCWNA